jgi:hypothetical protein
MADAMQYPAGLRTWTERALQRCSSQAEARHVAESIQVAAILCHPLPSSLFSGTAAPATTNTTCLIHCWVPQLTLAVDRSTSGEDCAY